MNSCYIIFVDKRISRITFTFPLIRYEFCLHPKLKCFPENFNNLQNDYRNHLEEVVYKSKQNSQ